MNLLLDYYEYHYSQTEIHHAEIMFNLIAPHARKGHKPKMKDFLRKLKKFKPTTIAEVRAKFDKSLGL